MRFVDGDDSEMGADILWYFVCIIFVLALDLVIVIRIQHISQSRIRGVENIYAFTNIYICIY